MIQSAGTGALRELSAWSTLSHPGHLLLAPCLLLRALPSVWISAAALTLLQQEINRILRTKPVSRGSPACPLPRVNIISPHISSTWVLFVLPSAFLNPVHLSRPPPTQFPVLSEFSLIFYQCHEGSLFSLSSYSFLYKFFEVGHFIIYFFGLLPAILATQSLLFHVIVKCLE